jgi:alpha-L-rhamnosidase
MLLASTAAAQEVGAGPAQTETIGWPAPTRINRPWTRWWWLGSGVDAPNLERLLTDYRNAGLGGVEICPIYGAKGYEGRFIDYLSPKWMDMLSVTTHAASNLDLGVDMTTGTGWPMGGPWIPADQASESVILRRYPIESDGMISKSGSMTLSELTTKGTVRAGMSGEGDDSKADGIIKASGGHYILLCLTAVGPEGSQVDLTGKVADGRITWSAPAAGWSLYSLMAVQPVQKVKRAAPGDVGNVVDPYSTRAIDTYLSQFTEAFRNYSGAPPRAQFHDSFEYYRANWTPDFFGEFSKRRGYDLRSHLPELGGDGDPDTAARVRQDYRQTIGELHEAYVARWTAWSHSQGSLTREQAHGAPANIEDVYATADIPETEPAFGGGRDDQVPMLKFASSAAHVTGRALASSETFTWLGEHFQVPLSQLKWEADLFYLSGVNHMFYHGTPYSPADAPWPGWLFYAAVNFGPNGGIWRDLPAFNAYATRCQSILQSGRPDNDVLLYFPVADFWQRIGTSQTGDPAVLRSGTQDDPLVEQFSTPGKWMLGSPFHEAAMELWHRGYAYDEVTDALLAGASVDTAGSGQPGAGPAIRLGGNPYRAIVIPPCKYVPVETLRRLLDLAKGGATVIFAGDIPTDVPGFANLEARRSELRGLVAQIPIEEMPGGEKVFRSARVGAGLILLNPSAGSSSTQGPSYLLGAAGIARESMADDGILCIRRAREGGTDYFLVNTGASPIEKWVNLSRPANSAVLLDPLLADHMGVAATRPLKQGISVFLQMQPGQSYILRTYSATTPAGPAWRYLRPAAERARTLNGDWNVHFVEGGPVLPRDFRTFHLGTWTVGDDPETKRFAGTASYSLKFVVPAGREAQEWRLDLGRVAESARVRVNGESVATLWCAPFSVEIGRFLQAGENTLEVEVTNVAANRIRDMDVRHVPWKSFYEINFVNRDYHPFDASSWAIRESGLIGPVVLTPMEATPTGALPAN